MKEYFNLAIGCLNAAQYPKAIKNALIAKDKIANLSSKDGFEQQNMLNHLFVNIIYMKSFNDLNDLISALSIIEEIKKFEGEEYNGINYMDSYMGVIVIERRIAELKAEAQCYVLSPSCEG